MSKQGSTIDPFENHPDSPRPEKLEAKDKDSFTKEEITRVISKLVKQVHKQPVPTWGFKKRDMINNLEAVLHKLEKNKRETPNTP